MKRRRSLKNKFKNMSFFKKNLLIVMASLVLVCFTMVGYAALNQTLNITGDLVLRAKKDIRVTELSILETGNDGYEKYNSKFTPDTITVITNLEKAGDSITYQATIANKGDIDMMVTNIDSQVTGVTDSVNLTISGLEIDDNILEGETKTFTIKLERTSDVPADDMEVGLVLDIDWEEAGEKYLTYRIEGNSVYEGSPNLIPETYVDPDGHEENGITYTVNEDGTITANGTATALSTFEIGSITFEANKTYVFGPAAIGSKAGTYRFYLYGNNTVVDTYAYKVFTSQTTASYFIYINAGQTLDNVVFVPEIFEGPTLDNPKDIYGVGDESKNLIDWDLLLETTSPTVTKVDNGYYVESYATSFGGTIVEQLKSVLKPDTTYTLSRVYEGTYNASNGMIAFRIDGQNTTIVKPNLGFNSGTFSLTQEQIDGLTGIYMYFHADGGTISNIQLEEGSSATDYIPYDKYKIDLEYSGTNLFNFDKVKGQAGGTADFTNQSILLPAKSNMYSMGQSFSGAPTAFNKFNEVLNIDEPGIYSLKLKVTADIENIEPRSNWVFNIIPAAGAVTLKPVVHTFENGYLFAKFNFDEELFTNMKNSASTFRLYMYTFRNKETLVNVDTKVSEFMFVKGDYTIDTMPEYQAYLEPITETIFIDEPLRKVGNYADYIDFETKTLVRNVFESEIVKLDPSVYKKLTDVVRFGNRFTTQRQKAHHDMLSKILQPGSGFSTNEEGIMHHTGGSGAYYFSFAWDRLGLTYDGTNVYKTSDDTQTALTDAEIIDLGWEIIDALPEEQKTLYMILETPVTTSLELTEILRQPGYKNVRVKTEIKPSRFNYEFLRKE